MELEELLQNALKSAVLEGAEYADARFSEFRRQVIHARDQMITTLRDKVYSGISVRAFYKGSWGGASGEVNTPESCSLLGKRATALARTSASMNRTKLSLTPLQSYKAKWHAPVKKDSFQIPVQQKTDLLMSINAELKKVKGVTESNSDMMFIKAYKLFANTLDSLIEQTQVWSYVDYTATAVGEGRFVTRDFQGSPAQMGYELIEGLPLISEAQRVGSEAVSKLKAPELKEEKTNLILLPSHTRLIIHETIGHATELDRVLGWEADYAGTSFATPEKLSSYRYGSPLFNVVGDRTQPHGMATCGFDDDGVPTSRWHIIKDGILVDYATTRDTAPLIGHNISHGCAYASTWDSFPILRMPNVCIEPGPESAPTLDELIKDTEDGILMDGMDSYSIDQQRINFQFGADLCKRIRKGKVEEILYNVTYESSNPEFWSSVDAVCRASEWKPDALFGCAKGQPVQITAMTHGSAPLRLRDIKLRRNGK